MKISFKVLHDIIDRARETYVVLENKSNEHIIDELKKTRKKLVVLRWTDEYLERYKKMSRVGHKFAMNRRERMDMYAALVNIDEKILDAIHDPNSPRNMSFEDRKMSDWYEDRIMTDIYSM